MEYTCHICGNIKGNTSYTGREMKFGMKEEFAYFKCAACGCLQIAEIPDDMSKYYDGYYAFKNNNGKENVLLSAYRRELFDYKLGKKSLLGRIFSKLNENAFYWIEPGMFDYESSILDVGCGSGRLLLKMANSGFKNLQGIDPYFKNMTYLVKGKEVKIRKKDIQELDEKFDFIMLHHVLEHLPDQHQTFMKLSDLMHPASKLLINIPVIDSYVWDEYGMNAFQLGDVPRHFFLHSLNSFELLAGKYNMKIDAAGFYSEMQIFTDSEKLKRDIPLYEKVDFTKEELNSFKHRIKKMKQDKQSGLVYFYLSLK